MPRVDFHTHSTFSDGLFTPEELAACMAARHVSYAALTDHDTLAGSIRFRDALVRAGVACVEGIELTTRSAWGEAHILAYALGTGHPGLAALAAVTQNSAYPLAGRRAEQPETAEVLRLARRVGVSTFLAHPFTLTRDPSQLEKIVGTLVPEGLDGIEALYGQYGTQERSTLVSIAERMSLAIGAGSDFHEPGIAGQDESPEMSAEQWLSFRALLSRSPGDPRQASVDGLDSGETVKSVESVAPAESAMQTEERRTEERRTAGPAGRLAVRLSGRGLSGRGLSGQGASRRGASGRQGSFVLRIVLPALAVLSLFLAVLFGYITPRIRTMLLDRKKEMIRELTISASSILAEYAEDARLGRSSIGEAMHGAADHIRDIRYGREGKDYFWITDMTPRMVMHPYRRELEGRDLSEYRDENGLKVFVEFVRVVGEKQEGYVEYLWQWKDERNHIVPKLSYVRRFAPWDWVIGTGIYIDDVNSEIAALTGRLVALSLGVAAVLALILAFMVQQSLAIERGRASAELAVRESRERYRALVEASTEGMVIVIDGTCTFANAFFLEMTGFSEVELQLRSFAEIVELQSDSEPVPVPPAHPELPLESSLRKKSGETIPVVLSSTRFMLGDREGRIFTVKETGISSVVPVLGIQRRNDLPVIFDDSIEAILESISAASSVGELGEIWTRLKGGIQALRGEGLRIGKMTKIIGRTHDKIIDRLIGITREEIGDAPCPFVFLALGSAGREEMQPGSDQDNALVFLPGEPHGARELPYFLELGERVCRALDTIGIPLCKGGTLAMNETCCASLADWESRFAHWIGEPEPEKLLDVHVFFDFRAVSGDIGIADTLRLSIFRMLKAEPGFFLHLANGVRNFRLPPLPLRTSADAKEGAALISGIVRAYALKYGIASTNTVNRLGELAAKGVLVGETVRDSVEAFEFLLQARSTLEGGWGTVPDRWELVGVTKNGSLGKQGEALARVALSQAALLQKRIGFDFLGVSL